MTADNMTTHKEMADKVLANIVYEASADGLTWIPSESTVDGQLVIKVLNLPHDIRFVLVLVRYIAVIPRR